MLRTHHKKIVSPMRLPVKNSWIVALSNGIYLFTGKTYLGFVSRAPSWTILTRGDRYRLRLTVIKINHKNQQKRSYVFLYLSDFTPNIYFYHIYAVLCPIFTISSAWSVLASIPNFEKIAKIAVKLLRMRTIKFRRSAILNGRVGKTNGIWDEYVFSHWEPTVYAKDPAP